MYLKLMYITNQPYVAQVAQDSGVDIIAVDMEILGKQKRQPNMDTVISGHTIADVKAIRAVVNQSQLLVRVNPIHENSEKEINEVIQCGADSIMLPYFKTADEVKKFIHHINKRVQVCLLWETPEAVENVDEILKIEGIDSIHIGLNDLHLGYGMHFMYELLADGTVDRLICKFKENGIFDIGFGGVARIGAGLLDARQVIAEHYRVGSKAVILARSFCNYEQTPKDKLADIFENGIREIREYEEHVQLFDAASFETNRKITAEKIVEIAKLIKGTRG